MTRIDLHTHSTASDGTDTPSELMRAAVVAELDVVALTDHDSTAGWAEAATAADAVKVNLIPGIEITTMRDSNIVHILGYLFDPNHPDLVAETERIRTDRIARAGRMVERINREYPLGWDEVLQQTTARHDGRPPPHRRRSDRQGLRPRQASRIRRHPELQLAFLRPPLRP